MSTSRRYVLLAAPLGLFAAAGFAFKKMLDRMEDGRFDPHAINNPLVGKPIPEFSLEGLGGKPGFSSADLRAAAAVKPVLVNFFASWCIPCAAEADILGALAADGCVFWGVAYEDKPEAAQGFLDKYGNPYARLARDASGRVSIDWGLYGVPETFLIGKDGRIAWHYAGPLADEIVTGQLRPALKAAGG